MPRKRKELADVITASAEAPKEETQEVKVSRRNLLSTGSALLNCACSGNVFGGLLKGKYYFLVGDSQSGKTFFSMTCFAEATVNRHFKDYELIYDNAEDGCLIDLETLFNEEVADRIRPPKVDKQGNAVYSTTIEEFYYNLDDACDTGKPFLYVLDSMDALDSEAADKKFDQHKKAHDKVKGEDDDGKEEKLAGSYGDGKAKKNSEGLRRVLNRLRETGSILIIVCQTRDNLNAFSFDKKTRSGGRALRFYATTEIWSSVAGPIVKTVRGKRRKIGTQVILDVKKNRITGKLHSVMVDIYPSYGIDDTGSMVDYLVEEEWWAAKGKPKVLEAPEFEFTGARDKLIRHIEDSGRVDDLRVLVGQCWKGIDEACALKRNKRYGDDAVGTD